MENLHIEPQKIIALILLMNVIVFFSYWLDKKQARGGGRRIPENSLLLMALLGGTPGAILASRIFRHKTKKGSYRAKFIVVVVVQIIALLYIFTKKSSL